MMRESRIVSVFLLSVATVFGQEAPPRKIDDFVSIRPTSSLFVWGDVYFSREHRIQKHARTGTYRLVDSWSLQRTTGSWEDCKQRLDELETEDNVAPLRGRVVILLHGFGSGSFTMRRLAGWLREHKEFDAVLNVSYPSMQQSILEHTRQLKRIVDGLPDSVTRIDFVGHSLGCIVIRRYLSGPLEDDWLAPLDKLEARGKFFPDKRIGRFVMIGPPNHGAEIAAKLIGNNTLHRRMFGESGDQLGIHWETTERSLGIPCCPFGIIAGGIGDERGFSPLITGDDDGIVSTEGTRLEGADDWVQFFVGHAELLMTEAVFDNVFRFLEKGRFRDEKE